MKRTLFFGFSAALLVPALAFAATFETGESIQVKTSSPGDVYVAGQSIGVIDPLNGDLFAAGRVISVNQTISQSLFAVGSNLVVSASVGDDIRAIGETVVLKSSVQGDVFIMGDTIVLDQNSSIGGDVFILGNDVTIAGTVNGNIRINGNKIRLFGTANEEVHVTGNTVSIDNVIVGNSSVVATILSIGKNGQFKGDVRYHLPLNHGTEWQSKVAGSAIFDASLRPEEMKRSHELPAALLITAISASTISGAVIIAILLLMTTTLFPAASVVLRTSPWKSLFTGVGAYIGIPFVILAFLLTFIGIPVALVLMVLYVALFLLTLPITAMVLAEYLRRIYRKKATKGPAWSTKLRFFFASIGVYIALKLLVLVPFIGWMIVVISIFFAVGALLMASSRSSLKMP